MASVRVFLLRHGHSTFQESYEVTNVDPGIIDAPLSDRGRAQVAAAARDVARLAPDLVVTSPLTRAIETTLGVVRDAEVRIRVDPLVRERLGDACDVGRAPTALAEAYPALDFAHLPEVWWHRGPPDERGLPIEPRELLQQRVDRFRAWLAGREEERILVVSHSGFLRYLSGEQLDNCVVREWSP
ncbi:MAG: histidine phosphatase family protein [Dehalococcoidia bacterium]